MNATKFNSHMQPVAQRPAQTIRACSKKSGILHILDTAARQTQLSRQKAVNAQASRLGNDTDNFQPASGSCGRGHDFLAHSGIVVLNLELASQLLERKPTGQVRVIRPQRRQKVRIDRRDMPTLQHRAVPGVVA